MMCVMQGRRARGTIRRPAAFWVRENRGLVSVVSVRRREMVRLYMYFESRADRICFAQMPACA